MTTFSKMLLLLNVQFIANKISWRLTNKKSENYSENHNAYQCYIIYNNNGLSTYFFTSQVPTLEDVLNCLFSDASCAENARDFKDFCGDLGYDSNSIEHLGIYNTCKETATKLQDVFGEHIYNQFMNMDREED